jgi:MOSC domain-containing protein YiiM
MPAGAFAENLTIQGATEASVCIGDRYRVGDCEIEVSQPRQPCWKISRRWGIKTLTKEVAQTGRTGWYVRVIRPGTLEAGLDMQLTARPNPPWSIERANGVMFGREVDRLAVIELMQLNQLADAWKSDLA